MYLPERVPSQPAASASAHVVGHFLQNFLFLNELQLIFRRKEAFKNIDMFISDRLSCHNKPPTTPIVGSVHLSRPYT